MTKERFVDIKALQAAQKLIREANPTHCRNCGDTQPKHGFYPLMGMAVGEGIYQTSALLCNRCALDDKQYEETFGEPKEQINETQS